MRWSGYSVTRGKRSARIARPGKRGKRKEVRLTKRHRGRGAICLLMLIGLGALLLPLGAPARIGTGELPFGVGERLTFSIRYGFIRAGTAELTVAPGPEGTWILTSRAWTNSFFDVFFKVRDRVRSWVDPVTLESLRFEKTLNEGSYQDREEVVFDRERRVAVYDDSTEVPFPPGARDVLAAFYELRTDRLPIGEKVPVLYHSSKKNWPIHAEVYAVEKVKVPAGEFRCFRVEPHLRSVGVFKQTGRLTIWITADERRMPVKLESKVSFGSFEAVLTEYRTP